MASSTVSPTVADRVESACGETAEAGGAFRFGRWATSGGGAAAAAATRTAARNPSERVVATLDMGRLRARKGCGPAAYPARGGVASCGLRSGCGLSPYRTGARA